MSLEFSRAICLKLQWDVYRSWDFSAQSLYECCQFFLSLISMAHVDFNVLNAVCLCLKNEPGFKSMLNLWVCSCVTDGYRVAVKLQKEYIHFVSNWTQNKYPGNQLLQNKDWANNVAGDGAMCLYWQFMCAFGWSQLCKERIQEQNQVYFIRIYMKRCVFVSRVMYRNMHEFSHNSFAISWFDHDFFFLLSHSHGLLVKLSPKDKWRLHFFIYLCYMRCFRT